MPLAELPAPQSLALAICPPQASTAVALLAMKVIEICVSDALAVRLPSETYETPVIVPPKRVISRSLTGSALKLVVGWPVTGDPAELGAGIGNVVVVAETPETPDVGLTVSAGCPKPACGSRRW